MNKAKLERRTARATTLRERYNPPYRVEVRAALPGGPYVIPAVSRDAARNVKREAPGSTILQRVIDGPVIRYQKVR